MIVSCASLGKRNKSPHDIITSNWRLKKEESSAASHTTGLSGKFFLKASTIDGDASTPYTVMPSSIIILVFGIPVPQPRSNTMESLEKDLIHLRTVELPIPLTAAPRPLIKIDAMPSYPLDLSQDLSMPYSHKPAGHIAGILKIPILSPRSSNTK